MSSSKTGSNRSLWTNSTDMPAYNATAYEWYCMIHGNEELFIVLIEGPEDWTRDEVKRWEAEARKHFDDIEEVCTDRKGETHTRIDKARWFKEQNEIIHKYKGFKA